MSALRSLPALHRLRRRLTVCLPSPAAGRGAPPHLCVYQRWALPPASEAAGGGRCRHARVLRVLLARAGSTAPLVATKLSVVAERYTLEPEALGAGNFGAVYAARPIIGRQELGERVAVKAVEKADMAVGPATHKVHHVLHCPFAVLSLPFTVLHETVQDMFITPLYQQHASHTLASRAYGPQPHVWS